MLVVAAEGEEGLADLLAEPIEAAGYQVIHRGTLVVGESVLAETEKALAFDGPVVLCGTIRAAGMLWTSRVINAARSRGNHRVYIVQMERDADVDRFTVDEVIARYASDPQQAIAGLLQALGKYYPLTESDSRSSHSGAGDVEESYRRIALRSHDIIDLANLPEDDRNLAAKQFELRRLYVALRAQRQTSGDSTQEWVKKAEKARKWTNASDATDRLAIGQCLGESKRVVVLGDPGAGKSTLVNWFATAYLLRTSNYEAWKNLPDVDTLPDADWLPLVVRCRDLGADHLLGSMSDAIRQALRKHELSDDDLDAMTRMLMDRLKDGTCLLLIDGLDEIADPVARRKFSKQLERVHVAYPDAPIIVTSRIVGYREMGHRLGRGFEHLVVTGLNHADKTDFIRRWVTITEVPHRRKRVTEELVEAIQSSDRISRLAANPMLLTTMALVKRKVGKLPTRRGDLYWHAVEVLLNWRSEVDQPIEKQEALPQLEYISYAMCDRGVQQLREDEIIGLLNAVREEFPNLHAVHKRGSHEFLRELERRTAILVEAGRVRHVGEWVPIFEFRHLTFQEYLAGRALVENRLPDRDKSSSLSARVAPLAGHTSRKRRPQGTGEVVASEAWREPLRLCLTSCHDDDVDNALLAVLRGSGGPEKPAVRRSRIVLAAQCLVDEPNVSSRVALEVLEQFSSLFFKVKVGIFDSVYQTAIEVQGSRWGRSFRSLLLEIFRTKSDARWIISMFWFQSVIFSRQLRSQPSRTLASFKAGNRMAGIEFALTCAGLFLRKRLSGDIISGLVDMLNEDTYLASAALFALDYGRSFGRTGETSLSTDLLLALYCRHDLDENTERSLTERLRERNDPRIRVAFIDRLSGAPDVRKVLALSGIGRVGKPEDLDIVLEYLSGRGIDVRIAAINALRDLNERAALPYLVEALVDENSSIQHAAVRALGGLADPASEPHLRGLIRAVDVSDELLCDVLVVLEALQRPESLPTIIEVAARGGSVAAAAIGAASKIGGPDAEELILDAISSSDIRARDAALEELYSVGSKSNQARKIFNAMLTAEDVDVRVATFTGYARGLDKVERTILSLDKDGVKPFIDPANALSVRRIRELASVTGITPEEVREKLLAVSDALGLRLVASTRGRRTAAPLGGPGST
ncbi:NACHT domain-containing protein [Saccharothrix saharensis]|uniref:NACHT domain-containing protein n=1 Tax=Saccharothrix saharensis TaxID=571190 RepID=UPI001B883A32|nr:HEAT repeat domain-containing protein [Saccharothrix saharensis]